MNLLQFRKNYYSQNGEDGVLEYIFDRININLPKEKWCVEFGAWDGKHLSNTFRFVTEGWNAVYIEEDETKYQDLLNTAEQYPEIIPICSKVTFGEKDSTNLNALLKSVNMPDDYELLSIDIDSYDLDVWDVYRGSPKVVVIEINSSVRPGIHQRHKDGVLQGNSFTSTLEVANDKGYTLVCHTGNMIFVRNDLASKIGLDEEAISNPNSLFITGWI